MIETVKEIKAHYANCGFYIGDMRVDKKFEPDRDELSLLHIGLNTVSKGEHIPEIERLSHTIKERVCTI